MPGRPATVVTTPKDMVRVPAALRERIAAVGARLVWDTPPDPFLELLP